TDAGTRCGEAIFDAGGRHLYDPGAGDGGDGKSRAGEGEGERGGGDRGGQADAGNGRDGGGGVQGGGGRRGGGGGKRGGGWEGGDIEGGQVIAKPGSITPHTRFKAEAYVLTKEKGGRHTPFFTGYRPQFYFRTTDVTGVAKLPEGVEMVMPGDNVAMDIELITPIAMEKGLRFAIREGGRTVGAGTLTEVIE